MTRLEQQLCRESLDAIMAFAAWFAQLSPAERELAHRFPPMHEIHVEGVVHYVVGYVETTNPEHAHLKISPVNPQEDYDGSDAAGIVICPDSISSFNRCEMN